MWGLDEIQPSIGLIYNAHRLIWLVWAYDVATTEVKVRYRSLYKRKMCAVLCKENTEPLSKRMGHVSLHIIQKSDIYGMRERFVQEKEFTICTQPFWELLYTWLWDGSYVEWLFLYMAYSFVNHRWNKALNVASLNYYLIRPWITWAAL